MNKILRNSILSLVTVCSLASCGAPQVEPEVAKQRAQAIATEQNKEEFSSPKTFTATAKSDITMSVKLGDREEKDSMIVESKHVVDLEKGYFFNSLSADGETEKVWVYLEEDKLIAAVDAPEIGKIYSEIPNANLELFVSNVTDFVNSVYATIFNPAFLDLDNLVTIVTDAVELGSPVFDGKTTYTSSEEGNLGISLSGDVTCTMPLLENAAPLAASGTIKEKINFDNYLMQGYNMKLDVKASLEYQGSVLSSSLSFNETLSVNYGSASISKPNLKDFTLSAE